MKTLVQRIQNVLTDDLLKPKFKKPGMPKTYGHCYVACEVLYHLGLKHHCTVEYARDDEGNVHWWLVRKDLDMGCGYDIEAVIDPTASQYTERGLKPPYGRGRKGGFLTKEPSIRARIVMARLLR